MKSKNICKFFERLFHDKGDNSRYYGSIVIPKARDFRKSLFLVSTPKVREDMSISFPYVGRAVRHCFFSHVFTFAQLVEKAWKTKLTQQWICLLMENPMVIIASW